MLALTNETADLLNEVQKLIDPGHLTLADHFLGYAATKCLVGVVELKVPDVLSAHDGPMKLDDLASACGARADRLRQAMRLLHNNNIFSYDEKTETFQNNHVSELLLVDHWTQWHNWITLYGNQFYDMARGIPGSLKEGEKRWPAQINYDTDLDMFSYFNQQGWVGQLHKTLGSGAVAQAPGILADYPWADVAHETVVDIGGGGGGFITTLMRAHPSMQGALFDLPHVIEHAKPFFYDADGQYADLAPRVADRNLISGDFFESVPAFKIYTMKWCLHDWKDDDALKILRNIRKAIIESPESRLVVLESVLAGGRSARLSRYGDLNMLMAANGGERTMAEWNSLAERSGWNIVRVHSLRNAWPCAIDMRPA
ncbi:O-methyltransferase-domain-containing protein [Lophiotrema nucula]|uniref:O-methyltransferase-domain-containing protein n=1 Tax=Lophiotrema nucula TaxID=690887 RepID=A0A6A5YHA0_9PLEO|nr:O-methyltransferase-domain-containing protein [Lophiotrema nucula]